MSRIAIYKNIVPNYDTNIHYYFTDPATYYDELNGYLVSDLEVDNYRINLNRLSLSLSNLPYAIAEIAEDLTYIIEYEQDERDDFIYWRCYYVNDYVIQSGKMILSLSVDQWGSYIHKANISQIHVSKTNREIAQFGQGRYLTPVNVNQYSDPIFDILGNDYIADTNATIGFVADCVIKEWATGENITARYIFMQKLSVVESYFSAEELATHSAVEIATRFVSGIKGTDTNNNLFDYNKLSIASIFLLPFNYENYFSIDYGLYFKAKTPYDDEEEKTILFDLVQPNRIKYNYVFDGEDIASHYEELNEDYLNIFGTRRNGLELTRSVEGTKAYIEYTIDYQGLKVMAWCGNQSKDLSNAFTLHSIGATNEMTWAKEISSYIKMFTSELPTMIAGVAASIATENPLPAIGAGLGVVGSLSADFLSNTSQPRNLTGSDDGFITFNPTSSAYYRYINNPIMLTKFPSFTDGERKTRMQGVAVDLYISSLTELNDVDLLGKTTLNPFNHTFVMCEALVDGVPIIARNAIIDKLTGGIYLDDLT